MDDLQRAIEQACRDIERYMAGQGQKVAVGFKGMRSERSQVHSDLLVLTVDLLVKHLGKKPKTEVVRLREEDITDVGHRAGVRALLEKYQQAIQNATDLAEGRPTMTGIQQVTEHAKMLRPDDPVPKMLIAVAQLRKDLCERNQTILDLTKSLEEKKDPEEQLRDRLRAKMKVKYLEQRDVLIDFCKHLVLQAWKFKNKMVEDGNVIDGTAEEVVDGFLERVGDGEDQR